MPNRLRYIFVAFLAVATGVVPAFGTALDDLKAGVSLARQGNREEGIRLITRAIDNGGLSRGTKAIALVNRAYALQRNGEVAAAMADYDAAIELEPSAAAYRNRGAANLEFERFEDAVEDFARALAMQKTTAYNGIWLHLARQKVGVNDGRELNENLARVDPERWPAQLLAYFAGRATPAEVKKAAQSPDPAMRAIRRCDYAFFMGEHHLAQGMKDALKLLREARDVCPRESVERALSRADLMRVGR